MQWRIALYLALIGSAFLVAISGKPILAVPKKDVDASEAYALVKASLPPEIEKLPDLLIWEQDRELWRMSFEACIIHRSQDGKQSCEEMALFDVRTGIGQVCMRVPARDFLMRDVHNPRVVAIQEQIRKRLGLTPAEYEKQKIECN